MEPRFKIHQKTELFSQKPVHFQVVVMDKSVTIWVGRSPDGLGDLSVGMPAINKNMVPAASNLLTRDMSDVSVDLSRRLGELSLHTQPLSMPSATKQLCRFFSPSIRAAIYC